MLIKYDLSNIFDPETGFEILNNIQPKYFQTKYPYDTDKNQSDDFTLTKNIIELTILSQDPIIKNKSKDKTKNKKIKKGGNINNIIIYH